MKTARDQLLRIREQVAELRRDKTTYKLATVTAVDTVTDTFTASIPGMSPLAGIPADPEHLPGIGTNARLTLHGATPIFEPAAIRYLSPEKAVDGDLAATWVVSGGVLTATSGQRAGVTPIGFQAWNASNVLTINLDGVNNLLTGTLQTGLTGTRRVEIGAAGSVGAIKFYAPTGSLGTLESFTATGSVEAIRVTLPIAGTSTAWNAFQMQSNEAAYISSGSIYNYIGGNGSGAKNFTVEWVTNRSTFASVPRIGVNETDSSFYHPPFGDTFFYERQSDGTLHTKLWLGLQGTYSSHNVGQSFVIQERQAGGTYQSRMNLTQTDIAWEWPGTVGRLVMRPANATVSGRFQFINQYSYGATLRFNSDSGGTNQFLEVTDATESAFTALKASAFTVSSSQVNKTDVVDLEPGALAMLGALQVRRFRRRQLRDADGQFSPEGREEIGLIAEDVAVTAPVLTVGEDEALAVDVMSTVGVLIAAVQELAAEVTSLRGRQP